MKTKEGVSQLVIINVVVGVVALLLLSVMFKSVLIDKFFTQTEESVPTSESSICIDNIYEISKKTIVLRVDDVQAFAWGDISKQMILDAESRQIPLSTSIIPLNLKDDASLYSFLQAHSCNLEIVLHGWNHNSGENGQTPEFKNKTKSEARGSIIRGVGVLEELAGEEIVTWVPPQNVHSSGTVEALAELGITRLSTEGSGRLDYHATLFDYGTDQLLTKEDVLIQCAEQFVTDTICVIMLHPQNFAQAGSLDIDSDIYQTHYIDLLDALKAEGYTFARFKDLSEV